MTSLPKPTTAGLHLAGVTPRTETGDDRAVMRRPERYQHADARAAMPPQIGARHQAAHAMRDQHHAVSAGFREQRGDTVV